MCPNFHCNLTVRLTFKLELNIEPDIRTKSSLVETYYAHRREKVLRFLMSLSCFQHHLLGEMQKLNSRKAGNNRDWNNGLK